jgi:hypothetical protein
MRQDHNQGVGCEENNCERRKERTEIESYLFSSSLLGHHHWAAIINSSLPSILLRASTEAVEWLEPRLDQ